MGGASGRWIPMVDLAAQRDRIDTALRARWEAVLRHGQFIGGPEVVELEARLAQLSGAKEAVTVASGTDAIILALKALGVEPGSAVIVPSFTFAGTAEAVVIAGGIPLFADVDPQTFLLTPGSLERSLAACTQLGLTPGAVLSVDLFGQPVDVPSLRTVTGPELPVVADGAQSWGASRNGQRVGTLADVTTTSFYPSKPLGCYGDGGAVLCRDPALAPVIRSLRNHGEDQGRYQHLRIGMNSRLDTLQAAVLLAKLEVLDNELSVRQTVADRYSAAIADLVEVPVVSPGVTSAWAQYTVQCPDRDGLRDLLADRGVATAIHYPTPVHRQPAYKGYPVAVDGCRVSETLAERVLSLPMHPYLSVTDQDEVVAAVGSVRGRRAALQR